MVGGGLGGAREAANEMFEANNPLWKWRSMCSKNTQDTISDHEIYALTEAISKLDFGSAHSIENQMCKTAFSQIERQSLSKVVSKLIHEAEEAEEAKKPKTKKPSKVSMDLMKMSTLWEEAEKFCEEHFKLTITRHHVDRHAAAQLRHSFIRRVEEIFNG